MIRAIVFDLDDTLFDFRGLHEKVLPLLAQYAKREIGMEEAVFLQENKRLTKQQLSELSTQAGAHSRAIRFQRLMEENALPLHHAAILNDLYWNSMLERMQPSPEVTKVLSSLHTAGYRIGLGSDMTADWQLKKLARLGLLPYFHFIVTSEEIAEKPDPRLFSLCAKKAQCAPEECLFVGDNVVKDVLGARAAGMQGVWLEPDDSKAAAHPELPRIRTLSELLPVVGI